QRSSRLPGVAIRMSTPAFNALTWWYWLTPPKTTVVRKRQPSAIGPETLADLAGKFARRRKNQGMRCAGYSRQIFMKQTLQDGKRECGGLARPRLRNSEQILAFI